MSIFIVTSLLSIWFCTGWLVLTFAKVNNLIIRSLLAPVIGMATITVMTTSASFAGLPINQSMWIILALLTGALLLYRKEVWNNFKGVVSYHVFLLVLNLCTVAIGLSLFGLSWQGLLNNDASTVSLAAQYFISHSFFSAPDIQLISTGIDYSSLSTNLYVAGGHRFGDTMLLGFSASLFHLNPDEVYMAHALAIRCSLIAAASLLIYQRGGAAWKLLIPMVLLSLSPLAIYTYLNQLISQLGGLALLITAAVLLQNLIDRREIFDRLLLPLAIVLAALCQSYPESISLLVLAIFIFGIFLTLRQTLPSIQLILGWGGGLAALLLIFTNVSIPNILTHLLGVTRWGLEKVQDLHPANSDFNYAFTPDVLTILFGFKSFQESIPEPWALALQLLSIILFAILIWFVPKQFNRHPLLMSLSIASLTAFLFLVFQGNRFGSFKMMLMLQPFIFIILSALLVELIAIRITIAAIAGISLMLLSGRVGALYINQGLSPSIPFNKIQELISKSERGVIFSAPGFLLGKFIVLRDKEKAIYFDQNFPGFYAGGDGNIWRDGKRFIDAKKREEAISHSKWLPKQNAFKESLSFYYYKHYKKSTFQCAPSDLQTTFESLNRQALPDDMHFLVPGGTIIPLNRERYRDSGYVLLDQINIKNFLVLRPSSLGDFYGVSDTVALYNLEQDPLTQSTFSATGRFLLLEVISPTEATVSLSMNFSRTYLSAPNKQLPEITFYGKEPVKLNTAGEGAISMSSMPISPCIINGRSYILVDFGVEPIQRTPPPPIAYRLLDVPYTPDRRHLTGYLRDISVISTAQHNKLKKIDQAIEQWDFEAFESTFEFSGMFEDGWMSNYVLLRPRFNGRLQRINLEMDIPIELAQQQSILSIEIDGKPLRQQALSAGYINIHIELPESSRPLISLSIDKPLVLTGGDGRSVQGLLKSVSLE